jgi:RNA-directed DNA polymerase
MQSWRQLNQHAKPGIDGVTMSRYRENVSENIEHLQLKLKAKTYRASAIQRVNIPKGDGKMRPLGLPTTEDKVVQQAVSTIVQSIWEEDFKPFSYGYRPSKSAHQAVNSLSMNLRFKPYGYIIEADIKGFFDNMSHDWLMKMLELRIDDNALLGLIRQWLKARIRQPDGSFEKPTKGTPQGGVISPVLANIYLHYVVDLWFAHVVKPRMKGNCMLIRYADDFVVAFHYYDDAMRFYRTLPKRLEKFGLSLSAEKTRLMQFNRFRPGRERHFTFLGFEFYWDLGRNGKCSLRRRTARDKQRSAVKALVTWIKQNRCMKLNQLMPQFRRKLLGFQNYFGLPDNSSSLNRYSRHAIKALFKWLNRRSQRRSYHWKGFGAMLGYFQISNLRVRKQARLIVDWY